MDIVLADIAPDPDPATTGVAVVVVLGAIVVIAAVIVAVVWLLRRSRS